MTRLLKTFEDSIDSRFTLYRRMSDHIGAPRTGPCSRAAQSDIRNALMSCARCSKAEMCKTWLDQGREGVPVFCAAHSCFKRLGAPPRLPCGTAMSLGE